MVVITEGGPSHHESSLVFEGTDICEATFSIGALKEKIWIKCMKRLSGDNHGFSGILEIHWKVEGSYYKPQLIRTPEFGTTTGHRGNH